ncbi:MAG: hypothetical protein LBC43_00550 [Bifidobacteriaceae bacterium]|jgi:F0F1-type ATP synthase membrane subunit a|nr:hypothetical protein [Bifidobacteriaceae bacterium]
MSGWEIAVIISSIINTIVIVVLLILICVLVSILIRISKKADDVANKVQNMVGTVETYVLKPAKLFKNVNVKKFMKFFTNDKPKVKVDLDEVEIVEEVE